MKQISARKFRVEFAALMEPVAVIRREDDGTFRELGTWLPSNGAPTHDSIAELDRKARLDGLKPKIDTARFTGSGVGFGHSSPAPKPSSKVKR